MEEKEKKWECKVCRAFLGFVSADKKTIRIKYKDLYAFIRGYVKVLCRKCGTENELVDDDYMEFLKQKLAEKVE